MPKVTLQTKIGALLKEHPEAVNILKQFNLDCMGCGGAAQETIELGAMAHGLDPKAIVDALNAAIK
ncbi:MAG: DUF1858 domain-containing protein [Deltaproteobacteria bacterium]|jgi:hybrid cluster-associated redox disulfide protein|nr:DUF1858 domain-containing protein [Deltaproteobacteria bacterium]MBW2476425.1 DUF1858 domain-containing protein [Deltaproteobacteria bacterium]MBW2503237.1 DUF1858 domain-containing protein [Deltaproteobacteria bacterium]MBW2520959.1 DUF1858 domain-containing protein [Deltaproteobacteria bacterium]